MTRTKGQTNSSKATAVILLLGACLLLIVLTFRSLPASGSSISGGFASAWPSLLDDGRPRYVPGQLIVKFRPDASPAQRARVLAVQGMTLAEELLLPDYVLVTFDEALDVTRMASAVQADPEVISVEPNFYRRALFEPNDPLYPQQWHLQQIQMPAAWDLSNGSGVTVAVVDSGVAYEDFENFRQAPDLAGTAFVQGHDFVNNDDHANDDNGHGTHVTGTIAQTTNNAEGVAGVAFGARIMPIKVLDENGDGTDADVANGITWAADHGAQVINMSLGGPDPSSFLRDAVENAVGRGVTVVAASGNDNEPSVYYPAAYEQAIAVGAVRFDAARAPYSNYGAALDVMAPGGDVSVDQNGDGHPDGVLQQTFDPEFGDLLHFSYEWFQGTSMATPHVSGVAALLIARGNATTPDQIRRALQDTARDLGPAGRDDEYGHGLIQAFDALNWVDTGPVPTPTPTTLTLVSVQDTELVASLPDEPRGDQPFMRVGSDAVIRGVQRALVQFDLSALPAGAVVNSAALELFLNASSQPSQSMGMTSYRVTRAWTESSATWNGTADAFAEAYGSVTVFADENQKFVSLDVTGLAQAWANGNQTNYGIMLRGAEGGETNWKQFGTRELGPGFEPRLVIQYSPPPATATPTPTPTQPPVPPTPTHSPTPTPTPEPLTKLWIRPAGQDVLTTNGPFTVTVAITEVVGLAGFQFDLVYDPRVVIVDSVAIEPFLGSSGRTVQPVDPIIDNEAGKTTVAAFSFGMQPGAGPTGDLATFTLFPQEPGRSDLLLRNVQVTNTSNDPVPVAIRRAEVTVRECIEGDFDCDCDVDIFDLVALARRFNAVVGDPLYDPVYDLKPDGVIDIFDLVIVAGQWGVTCERKIAFVSSRGDAPESRVFFMNGDGSGTVQLTHSRSFHPAWSPDHSQVAFGNWFGGVAGRIDLYIMDTNGRIRSRLVTSSGNDTHPTWSPDGRRIAFQSDRDGNWEVYVVNVDGTGLTNLTRNAASDTAPAWSPDGTKIAFSSNRDGNAEIWVMRPDGAGLENLTNSGREDYDPAWSPDGTKIAFSSRGVIDSDIYVMDFDGRNQTNLTRAPGNDEYPTWSPDGLKIAFATDRDSAFGTTNWEIYVMNRNGSGQANITNHPLYDHQPAW